MKFRFFASLLLAAMAISLVSGCAAPPVVLQTPPTQGATAAPEALPNSLPAVATEAPAATAPAATETAALITKEEAIAIALADAGFTEAQVTRLRAEFDWDDRIPEYEVEFSQGDFEYDYEIHAETGAIRAKDKDWKD
jgi:hypothetical protein